MSLTFHGDTDELLRYTRGLAGAEKAMKSAVVRALNRTASQTVTFLARTVAREYNVRQAAVKKELRVFKANFSALQATVYGEGSHGIPLYRFSPSPKTVPSTKRLKSGAYRPAGGISVMIHRGARKTVKGAFLARMKSGHVGVFKRSDKQHLPVDELFGPSPLRIFDNPDLQQRLDDFTEETYDKNFQREADFYLKREGLL